MEFNQCMKDMKALNPGAVEWLDATTKPEHWADLYFKGKRYEHLTSNIAEAFNAKLLLARQMPILAMLEEIRHQVMGWFVARRHSKDLSPGGLVSKVGTEIQELIKERARRYRYRSTTDNWFEIHSQVTLAEYIVKLDVQTCSCRVWQTKVPLPPSFVKF
jgi:zinc finger SWIM domain-containing protein 3